MEKAKKGYRTNFIFGVLKKQIKSNCDATGKPHKTIEQTEVGGMKN